MNTPIPPSQSPALAGAEATISPPDRADAPESAVPPGEVPKTESGGGFYQVERADDGTFGFRTPIGRCDGFLSRSDAERAAVVEERENREEAGMAKGPIAAALRKHFAMADGKEEA